MSWPFLWACRLLRTHRMLMQFGMPLAFHEALLLVLPCLFN